MGFISAMLQHSCFLMLRIFQVLLNAWAYFLEKSKNSQTSKVYPREDIAM